MERLPNNSARKSVQFHLPEEFYNTLVEDFHAEIQDNEFVLVSDGIRDIQKEIESQAKNAGLVNILKQQELRYGTIENAIARNETKKVYADVSDIPLSVGEQQEYVKSQTAELDALAKKLGISTSELLTLTKESFEKLTSQKESEVKE